MSTDETDYNLSHRESAKSQNDSTRSVFDSPRFWNSFDAINVDDFVIWGEGGLFESVFRELSNLGNSEDGSWFLNNSNITSRSANNGVDDEFLDSLERVDVKSLSESSGCSICINKFVDNSYPLIVKLPCFTSDKSSVQHLLDLDCIAPWLKTNLTCPMCRSNIQKARQEHLDAELGLAHEQEEEEEEEEEEEDDLHIYG